MSAAALWRLELEADFYELIAFRDDRVRDRRNRRDGQLTLRYTWEDVHTAAEEVAEDVERAASSRSIESSTKS